MRKFMVLVSLNRFVFPSSWLLMLLLVLPSLTVLGQPTLQWQKTYGGSSSDIGRVVRAVPTGGYILCGTTQSNNGDVVGFHPGWRGASSDAWVLRVSATGQIQWQRTLGAFFYEAGWDIQNTNDGGFIFLGTSANFNSTADVPLTHGAGDLWVVKFNSNGVTEWQKCLGGSISETPASICQTPDGGYIVLGNSNSNDFDVSGNHGDFDYWVVKLDNVGNITWQRSLGGTLEDRATDLAFAPDGGYIVSGYTQSKNGDVSGHHGSVFGSAGWDVWVVKLTNSGELQWQKCLGGTRDDVANSIVLTNDGGYLLAGGTTSNNGDVSGHFPGYTSNGSNADYWVVKLNSSGNIQWQKCLGGKADDWAHDIEKTADGGFIVAGQSNSKDGQVSGNHGVNDYWVVKINSNGGLQWQKSLGGTLDDVAKSICVKQDGGFVVMGQTKSNNGDVSGNHGQDDWWLVSMGASANRSTEVITESGSAIPDGKQITVFPNPASQRVNFRISGAIDQNDKITIVNFLGQPVKQAAIHSELTSISLDGLASGVYIYTIISKGSQVYKGRFVISKEPTGNSPSSVINNKY